MYPIKLTEYTPNQLSIAILDHERPVELQRLLNSLGDYLDVPCDIVYCHDGALPDYALEHYRRKDLDTMITTAWPRGCGIQTRQLFQACMTPYILYCQVDQYLTRPFTQDIFNRCKEVLEDPTTFYVDLAGNQGQGRPSERALIMKRQRYLDIPGIDSIIGGPGPYANHRWTEQHLQEHMASAGLRFATANPLFFADNGKWSRRSYLCGGETLHSTDEKMLYIVSPLRQRYDFPNLRLSDDEWAEVLAGKWPAEGKIPEADKPHSFKVW